MTNKGPTVDIGQVFAKPVTFAQLATAFHVNAVEILGRLCKPDGTNIKAFDILYAEFQKSRPDLHSYTDRDSRARQYWNFAHGNTSLVHPRDLPFLAWKIPQSVTIRLPLSAKHAVLVDADQTTASAFIKLAISTPDLAKLELIADHIENLAGELDALVNEARAAIEGRGTTGIHCLLSAQQLLSLMYGAIPSNADAQARHHAAKHAELYSEVQKLTASATTLMCDGKLFDQNLHGKIDHKAKELLAELSSKRSITVLNDLLPYYDIAEAIVEWNHFEFALVYAITVLAKTKFVDDLVADHAVPLFKAVAEPADVKRLLVRISSEVQRSALANDWRSLGSGTVKDSLVATLGTVASLGSGMVGNSRGPASMLVALVTMAGPACSRYLALRSVALSNSGVIAGTLCYRVLLQIGQFADTDADALWDAIFPPNGGPGKIDEIRKINFSNNFMSGNMWAGAYAIANFALFLSVFSSDEDITWGRMAVLVQSASQTTIPILEIIADVLARYEKNAAGQFLLRATTGLATFAGAISVILAGYALYKERGEFKQVGYRELDDWLTIAGSWANIAAVTSWTAMLVFTGPGTVAFLTIIMSVASIVAAATAIAAIGYYTIYNVPGTSTYLLACVDEFKASDNAKVLLGHAEFAAALGNFEQLLDVYKRDLVSFSGKKDQLHTLIKYFSPEGSATIVEMSPDVVKHILGIE